jgi:hypothetical protein
LRRSAATDDGGQYDRHINFRILIESCLNAADPPAQNYGRATADPADQALHYASQRLTQCTLLNKFHNHNDLLTYGRSLNK